MLPRHFFAIAVALAASGTPSLASAFDWSEYIANGGSTGLETIKALRDSNAAAESAKLGTSIKDSLGTKIGYFSLAVTAINFVPNTALRMREFNEGLIPAAGEQAGINLSNFTMSWALSRGLTACFASGSCALSGAGATVTLSTIAAAAGIGVDAYLVSKDVENALAYLHEQQQLAASLQKVKGFQQRVDEQNNLKQKLQSLKNTSEWQSRRTSQLAQEKVTQATSTNPPKIKDPRQAPPPSKVTTPPTSSLHIYTTTPRIGPQEQTPISSTVLTPTERQRLKNNVAVLTPPPPPAPPPPKPVYVPPPVSSSTFRTASPAGISLSIAAAMRMRLPVNLQGLQYKEGRIVFSGRLGSEQSVDAALFLTAMRAACEPGDPFFSLDPDDGRAWSEETNQIFQEFWSRVRKDFDLDGRPGWDKRLPNGFHVRSILARRDYPTLWHELSPKYPNLKSRLVFRPEWLRGTRFGEILYKADVLLKELSSGVPVLEASTDLRARRVDHFVSSDARSAAKRLLYQYENGRPTSNGQQHRLWFDLFPQPDQLPDFQVAVTVSPENGANNAASANLRKILKSLGYIDPPGFSRQVAPLIQDGDIIDLSGVYPKMFVRRHDFVTGKDIPGSDPNLDELADDVNGRTQNYVSAYDELRALMNVFRAYLAAVSITLEDSEACHRIRAIPLLPSEKVSRPLPSHHQSELASTVATYIYKDGRRTTLSSANVLSMSGGISLRGKAFYGERMHTGNTTAVTLEFRQEIDKGFEGAVRSGNAKRQLVALTVDAGALLGELGDLDVSQPSLPEEVLRKQEQVLSTIDARKRVEAEASANRYYQERLKSWEEVQRRWPEARRQWEEAGRRWREADELWRREERKATVATHDELLKARFGLRIDATLAAQALPYALMSNDFNGSEQEQIRAAGWTRLSNWQPVFRQAGYSDRQLELLQRSGFHATLYSNERTGELTIAYGAHGEPLGIARGRTANLAELDLQYKAAADFAWIVRHLAAPGSIISLTGRGLGGSLATYAGEQVAIPNIITFDAPSSPAFTRGANLHWINIAWVPR